MPRHLPLWLAVAALVVSLPALAGAGPTTATAGLVPWVSGGLSLGTLLALAVQWGRTRQQQQDHERRICSVEDCASSTPQRLATVEATLQIQSVRDDERHGELLGRLGRIETRIDAHGHGE
jgi:hypothetical protein